MKKKTKILIGVVIALIVLIVIVAILAASGNSGAVDFLNKYGG